MHRRGRHPPDVPRKRRLSPARRRLLAMMQEINFGWIEDLTVRDGEPVFDPAPHEVSKIKMGGENGPRPEAGLEDFALKGEVEELFEHLCRLGSGVVRRIEIKHGLPFSMEIEKVSRP